MIQIVEHRVFSDIEGMLVRRRGETKAWPMLTAIEQETVASFEEIPSGVRIPQETPAPDNVRVLHNRMISYYSPPGEVYSVVRRMRIPHAGAGDKFCLKGIVHPDTTESNFLSGALVVWVDSGGTQVISFEDGLDAYLSYNQDSQTLTVKQTPSGSFTVLFATMLNYYDIKKKLHGCFTRDRRLVPAEADIMRTPRPVDIHDFFPKQSEYEPCLLDAVAFGRLLKKGYEFQQLRRNHYRALSLFGKPEESVMRQEILEYAGVDSISEILPGAYVGPWHEYFKFLRFSDRHNRRQWRWGKNITRYLDLRSWRGWNFVRVRRRRGMLTSEWTLFKIRKCGDGELMVHIDRLPSWIPANM